MVSDYAGPVGPTTDEWDTWYVRLRDLLHPIQMKGWALACSHKDRSLIEDMLERLAEDPEWRHESVPPLIVSRTMRAGELRPADPETAQAVHMSQVVDSRTGFGRFGGLSLPGRNGLHDPWKATMPKGFKPPEPDSDGGDLDD